MTYVPAFLSEIYIKGNGADVQSHFCTGTEYHDEKLSCAARDPPLCLLSAQYACRCRWKEILWHSDRQS